MQTCCTKKGMFVLDGAFRCWYLCWQQLKPLWFVLHLKNERLGQNSQSFILLVSLDKCKTKCLELSAVARWTLVLHLATAAESWGTCERKKSATNGHKSEQTYIWAFLKVCLKVQINMYSITESNKSPKRKRKKSVTSTPLTHQPSLPTSCCDKTSRRRYTLIAFSACAKTATSNVHYCDVRSTLICHCPR